MKRFNVERSAFTKNTLQVAREFGINETKGMRLLQSAATVIKDPVIQQISLYRRFNRMRDGNLKVGDVAPNLQVLNKFSDEIDLLPSTCRPVVLVS